MNESLRAEDNLRGVAPQSAAGAEADRERVARPLPEDALIILPVRNLVLFPGVVLPITIGRTRSQAAAQEAARSQRQIGVLLQRRPEADAPGPDDLHWIGTSASVLRYVTGPDSAHHVICQGDRRFRVLQFLEGYPYTVARVQFIDAPERSDSEIEARALSLKQRAIEILRLLPQAPEEMVAAVQGIDAPGRLADLVAGLMEATAEEKQALLETFDLKARLDKLLEVLGHRIEVLKLSREIDERTKETLEERNREHILREQMRTIQKELGEGDEQAEELKEVGKAIADAHMPEEVEKQARKELKRLERMPEAAGEYSMVRTYLEWLTELPWKREPQPTIDIAEARRILDEDHYGLEKIKRRILEYLAVRKLNPEGKSPILCFVGPPGVGKTSLGQSIARAMNRKFVRLSLGGVRDEAEIRGHRRTYIGAMPGRIVQAMKQAGSMNPVFMLDELDKLTAGGFSGDPAAALLEVLDPAQNNTFRDHYLEVPLDLSRVLFIATANQLGPVHPALLDRMEIIELSGYSERDKQEIARTYLIPRQAAENGLPDGYLHITDGALARVISEYTREAGVRSLERRLGALARKSAAALATSAASTESPAPVSTTVDVDDVPTLLGPPRFKPDTAFRLSRPGVATGLAWTEAGGDVLYVEAALMPSGSGQLMLTGQLGAVMQESARAALSHIRQQAAVLGIDPQFLQGHDLHVHVPAGAIPKDGPSAGVTMATAIVSALRRQPVAANIAMTGEITLSGMVLPVGGVREKVLAANRQGLNTVILPERNLDDVLELPDEVRNAMRFVPARTLDDVLRVALPVDSPAELASAQE